MGTSSVPYSSKAGIAPDYEAERGKFVPNIVHGTVQGQLIFLLRSAYGDRFIFSSGLALDATPPTTPKILGIYFT